MDVPPPEITRAPDGARDGLIDAGERLVWVGAVEEAEGAPRLRVAFSPPATRALRAALDARDAHAAGAVLAAMPLPFATLRALAVALGEPGRPLAEGRVLGDRRWQRVLATVEAARAGPARPPGARCEAVCDLGERRAVQLVALDGGALLVRVREAERAQSLSILRESVETPLARFALEPNDTLELLPALEAPPGCVAAVLFRALARRAQVWAFDRDGRPVAAAVLRCPSRPERFSLRKDRLWLHLRAQHVSAVAARAPDDFSLAGEVGANAREEPRPIDSGHVFRPLCAIDGWLLVYRGVSTGRNPPRVDELRWVDLGGRREDRTLPWYQELRAVVPKPERAWVSSGRGIWALHPTLPSLFRWAHAPGTLEVAGDEVWLAFRNAARSETGVLAVHLPTSHERWRVHLSWTPHAIVRVPGAVFTQVGDWSWIDEGSGAVVSTGPGHDRLQAVELGARAVVAAGHDLLFLDEGRLVRRIPFGCSLHLSGLLASGHVAVELEDASHPPPALLVFAMNGELVAELAWPPGGKPASLLAWAWNDGDRLAGTVSGGRLWLRDGGRLSRVELPRSGGVPLLPALALSIARDEEHSAGEDAARTVTHARLCAFGCRYTGVEGATALRVEEGSFATMIGGRLSGTVAVEAAATLVLLDVDESGVDDWEIDPGGFIVRVSAD